MIFKTHKNHHHQTETTNQPRVLFASLGALSKNRQLSLSLNLIRISNTHPKPEQAPRHLQHIAQKEKHTHTDQQMARKIIVQTNIRAGGERWAEHSPPSSLGQRWVDLSPRPPKSSSPETETMTKPIQGRNKMSPPRGFRHGC